LDPVIIVHVHKVLPCQNYCFLTLACFTDVDVVVDVVTLLME